MLTSQSANSSSHVNDTATSEIDDTVTIEGIGSECAHPTRRCPTPLIKNIKLHHIRVLLIWFVRRSPGWWISKTYSERQTGKQ